MIKRMMLVLLVILNSSFASGVLAVSTQKKITVKYGYKVDSITRKCQATRNLSAPFASDKLAIDACNKNLHADSKGIVPVKNLYSICPTDCNPTP